jgi:hypothetical protein
MREKAPPEIGVKPSGGMAAGQSGRQEISPEKAASRRRLKGKGPEASVSAGTSPCGTASCPGRIEKAMKKKNAKREYRDFIRIVYKKKGWESKRRRVYTEEKENRRMGLHCAKTTGNVLWTAPF